MLIAFKNFITLLKPYLKDYKFYLFGSLILVSCITPINTYISVTLQQYVIDSLYAKSGLINIILIILGGQSVLFLSIFIKEVWNKCYGEKKFLIISEKLNMKIMEKVLEIDYKNFDDPKFYESFTWASKEYVSKVETSKLVLTEICSVLLTISALVTYISSTGKLVLLVTVIVLILSVLITAKINKINIDKKEKNILYDRQISYCKGVFQNRSYIIDLLSNRVSFYLFKMFERADEEKIRTIKLFNPKLLALNSMNTLVTVLLNIFIMAFLSWQVITGQITVGSFAGTLAATNSLYLNLRRLFSCYNQIYDLSLYYEKIQEFLNFKSDIEGESTVLQQENSELVKQKPYSVEFKNVSFSYPNSNFSLQELNFYVGKGEKVAIVGENGAGKSTIFKLLLRLYEPDDGQILYNGIDLKKFPIKILRREIGLTAQFPNVYALPFIDNICLYDDNLAEDKIIEIINQFNFNKILKKNSASIKTQITKQFDKNGILLSGGEKQLLALSRIATKNFGLFILDEISSSLDPNAEYEFNQKLFNLLGESTAIIIAHRLSSIKRVDRIIVIDNGTVAESGSHIELINKRGIYYSMYKKQASGYIE